MRCEWIPPESSQWSETLATMPHDFYHLPTYAQLLADVEGGRATACIVAARQERFIAPLIVRSIGSGGYDAVSPYGYAAPLWSPSADEEFVNGASAAFVDALRRAGIVSAFIRLHPLLSTSLHALEQHGDVMLGGETVFIDLRLPADELWRETRENHRRSIRRAEREGYTARHDEEWHRLGDFLAAYRETMTRVGAGDYYLFPDRYFDGLKSALQERLHLLVVEHEGRVAAAALFTECCGIVEYHLGGTRDEFLAAAPMKLLFHFARSWYKERGAATMHLGGGLGARHDSLFHFKAGFSHARARFHSWRIVAAPTDYQSLVENWCRETGRRPSGDFFPSYREPR